MFESLAYFRCNCVVEDPSDTDFPEMTIIEGWCDYRRCGSQSLDLTAGRHSTLARTRGKQNTRSLVLAALASLRALAERLRKECVPLLTAMILKYVLSISPHCSTTHFISTERLPSRHAIGGGSPRFHPSFHHHLRHRLPLLCLHLCDGSVYL